MNRPLLKVLKKLQRLRKQLGIGLGLAIFLLTWALLSQTELSQQAALTGAITLMMATFWITEAIPIAATSLLPIPLFPLLGIMPSKQVTLNYANHLIFLFLGGFMIAAAMERWQLHRRIALTIILFIGPKPRRLILGFIVATAFLSMWISNTATAMMMLPIGMAVVSQLCKSIDQQARQQRFALVLMLAVAYAASVGGMTTLVGTPPNIVFAGYMDKLFDQAPQISFFQWMKLALPFTTLFLAFIWVFLAYGVLGDLGLTKKTVQRIRQRLHEEHCSMGQMNRAEKRVLVAFLITALLWIFRNPISLGFATIPGWSELFANKAYLHDTTVAVFMGLSLFFLPSGEKSDDNDKNLRLLDWPYFEKKAPWGVLLLFGGGFALASGLQQTGVTAWFGEQLAPFANLPTVFTILAVALLVSFLTEVTSNTATSTVILPILASLAVSMGIHPLALMLPATLAASSAFMLPVATPPNAIVFSSGWIKMMDMAKVGFLLNLIGALLITLLIAFLAGPILGFDIATLPEWAVSKP